MFTTKNKNETIDRRLTTTISSALALALVAGVAAPVSAQNQTEREQAIENPGAWEWEADEGYHEEEWYDPSDWFDGDDFIDYEYDRTDVTESEDYGYFDYDYTRDTEWYDGYWDGYYDGYNDDQYGYDTTDYLRSTQSDAYSSGYNDGFYDNDRNYSYDPYYYVVTWDYENARQSDRQRAGDEDRQRGDRAMPSDRKSTKRGEESQSKRATDRAMRKADAQGAHEQRVQRVRGEVESIEYLRGTRSDSGTDLIARVTFKEDGKKRVVNLGPKMSKDNVPFEKGDRVTFKGVRQKHEDRRVLTTHRLNVNGDTVNLAASPRWDKTGNRQAMKSMEGTVERISDANMNSQRFTVLKVMLRDGSSQTVAIPTRIAEDRAELDVQRGDRVRIKGRERMIDGRRVLHLEQIHVNGDRLSMR